MSCSLEVTALLGLWEVGVYYNSSKTVNKIRLLKYVLQSLRTDKLYLLEKKKLQSGQIHFK